MSNNGKPSPCVVWLSVTRVDARAENTRNGVAAEGLSAGPAHCKTSRLFFSFLGLWVCIVSPKQFGHKTSGNICAPIWRERLQPPDAAIPHSSKREKEKEKKESLLPPGESNIALEPCKTRCGTALLHCDLVRSVSFFMEGFFFFSAAAAGTIFFRLKKRVPILL